METAGRIQNPESGSQKKKGGQSKKMKFSRDFVNVLS